jgi:hypothetical protein
VRPNRRDLLTLAAGLPLLAGSPAMAGTPDAEALMLFDGDTLAGQRFAAAARSAGLTPIAITGDRIRQVAPLLAARPRLMMGATRHADRLLIGGAAMEQGYREQLWVAHDGASCRAEACSAWSRQAALLGRRGDQWPELLAALSSPGAILSQPAAGPPSDAAGWVLARPA